MWITTAEDEFNKEKQEVRFPINLSSKPRLQEMMMSPGDSRVIYIYTRIIISSRYSLKYVLYQIIVASEIEKWMSKHNLQSIKWLFLFSFMLMEK